MRSSTKSQQTIREFGTQMERSHVYLDNSNDYVVIVRAYTSSAQLNERKLQATVFCQVSLVPLSIIHKATMERVLRSKKNLVPARTSWKSAEKD